MKCATIILIAKYLSNHQLEVKEGYIVFIPILIALLSSFLVLNQPDLGTAVIIFAPVLPMMLWAGLMALPFSFDSSYNYHYCCFKQYDF